MKMMKKNGGFTLVELIVVIAILAILAGVAIPAYSGYIKKANATADTTALSAVKTACMATYATEGQVTKIVVNDKDAADDVKNTIEVYLDNGTTPVNPAAHDTNDFKTFYNIVSGSDFSIDLKTGKKATWDVNSTTNPSEWVIEE